jgi:hypothetical protein
MNINPSDSKKKSITKKDPSKRINVILDLDNTLIYSIPMEKIPKTKTLKWLESFTTHKMDNDYLVVERPGLQKFLDWLSDHFNITIWSAASPEYVDFIRKKVFKKRRVHHVFNSNHCEDSQKHYGDHFIKNLELLWDKYDLQGYGPYNTLIIDDLKYNTNPQPYNSLHIKKFIAREDTVNDSGLEDIRVKLSDVKKNFNKNVKTENTNFKLTKSDSKPRKSVERKENKEKDKENKDKNKEKIKKENSEKETKTRTVRHKTVKPIRA